MKKLIVLAASLAMVAGFTMTAAAADWNFYGSSRVSTFWTDVETIGTSGSDDNYAQALQGNARFGGSVKVSDELTGGFEYGTGVNVRLLYGEWNFGAGSFLVGQTYSPLNMFYSNQVYGGDTDLLAYGGVYSGREQMLRLKFGSFQFAILPVNETDNLSVEQYAATYDARLPASGNTTGLTVAPANAAAQAAVNYTETTEASFPAMEASYSLSFDPVSLKVAGGYQTYERTINSVTYDIDSYILALGGSANFGMAYLKGNVYFGENASNMIWLGVDQTKAATSTADQPSVNATTSSTDDVDNFGYILVAGAKLNDMFSVEAGYGNAESEKDSATEENEVTSYYLQSTITFAPGVFVVPEIGVIDGDEDGEQETTYFGAKWQINF